MSIDINPEDFIDEKEVGRVKSCYTCKCFRDLTYEGACTFNPKPLKKKSVSPCGQHIQDLKGEARRRFLTIMMNPKDPYHKKQKK